jgi:DNA mismatch repair protein MutS
MRFSTDQQTLNDLNILGRPGVKSIFEIYNATQTRKGAEILEHMFRNPLSDQQAINNRSGIIRFFASVKQPFPFKSEQFDHLELYLQMDDQRTRLSIGNNTLEKRLTSLIAEDINYKNIHNGIIAIMDVMQTLISFTAGIEVLAAESPYHEELIQIRKLLLDPDFEVLQQEKVKNKLPYVKVVAYDQLLRFTSGSRLRKLLSYIYQLDVYMSVARVALKYQFIFAKALGKELHRMDLEGVYHPHVQNAVPNTIQITPDSNIIFLTGANMAGKSTFMKSMGIALFVAHLGFPVAAKKMEFSVMDGIFTTINLPDDLDMGNSHFYAEVLRLKKVAREAGSSKNLFIIFDELFRGTNVKDAYEATIAVTEAFAQKKNCMFIVSTHIIEAAAVLKERCSNINFTYLPTRMSENIPVYTYRLEPGVTEDRHGMVIINNERILEILKNRKRS